MASSQGSIIQFTRGEADFARTTTLWGDAETGSRLGWNCDADFGLLVAGAYLYGPSGAAPGRAYLWDLADPSLPRIATIDPPNVLPGNTGFGYDVAVIDRDTIAIGQPETFIQTGIAGMIHIYHRTATGWQAIQTLDPNSDAPPIPAGFVLCGRQIEAHGDTLVLGAGTRRVFIYERDASGLFHFSEALESPNAPSVSDFGAAVDVEADLIAVSDTRSQQLWSPAIRARVFLYRRGPNGWALEETLEASDGFLIVAPSGYIITEQFGYEVEIDEGRVIIGAPWGRRELPPQVTRPGSAYVFEQKNGAWVETYRLWNHARPYNGSRLGFSVALEGDVAVVSAPREVHDGTPHGSANFYFLPFGESVCDGVVNSVGSSATLELTGDRRVDFGHLEVDVTGLPPAAFGYVLASRTNDFIPNPGGAQGTLCIGGTVLRFPHLAAPADASGMAHFDLDPDAFPDPQTGPFAVQPGDTFTFQVWYRDGPSSNFSEAVQTSFR